MRPGDLRKVDLNLLAALYALVTERSVTGAAQAIGLSQPALSRSLDRLRHLFDDPLLIRIGRRMSLTPCAEKLCLPIADFVRAVEHLLEVPAFNPQTAARHVRICATDAATESTLAKALTAIGRKAPCLTYEITQIAPDALSLLANDTLDFVIDVFPTVPRGFRKQDLFLDDFVCLMRRDHPLLAGRLTRAAYANALHIRLSGTGGTSVELDDALRRCRIERRIAMELPSFMAAPLFLLNTDWLLTLPSGPARRAQRHLPLEFVRLPFSVSPIPLTLVWHERSDRDQGHLWLRQNIASVFSDQAAESPTRSAAVAERKSRAAHARTHLKAQQ